MVPLLSLLRSFQSLSGFQVRCNTETETFYGGNAEGFNPYRVFKFVATRLDGTKGQVGTCFNPYRVFKFVATRRHSHHHRIGHRFQSLSGFQVRCNLLSGAITGKNAEFQSLSGFQVRCNQICGICQMEFSPVSIPIGFSSSLQHSSPSFGGTWMQGFNPYRVFKFVATAPFEWLFLAIILSKSQKLRPPGMNLFRTRPL